MQSLTSLHHRNCSSAKACIIAITIAHHAGSECNKAQDCIIFNLSTYQQFYSARAQHFIWFTLTFDNVDLCQGTTLHHIQHWHSTVENSAIAHHYLISMSTFEVCKNARMQHIIIHKPHAQVHELFNIP